MLKDKDAIATVPEVLRARAASSPEQVAYRILKGPHKSPEEITYGALWAQASKIANELLVRGLHSRCVLIACRHEYAFLIAFFSCLIAGAIAVPTVVPKRTSLLSRLNGIAGNSAAQAVLTDSDEVSRWCMSEDSPPLVLMDVRESKSSCFTCDKEPQIRHLKEEVALLQYTSGSTGSPKGVIITHGNLVSNACSIRKSLTPVSKAVTLVALPLFHDMGLIAGVVEPMLSGDESNLMSPADFAQFPDYWLRQISELHVTTSGGPNYMFEYAARTVKDEQLSGIDLSTWRNAFCGAEPIKVGTLNKFVEKFAVCGFSRSSFWPCYGLAEATLLVSGQRAPGPPNVLLWGGQQLVSCGRADPDTKICVVDPQTREVLPEGEVGEIWIAGPGVAAGYWGKTVETEETFNCCPLGVEDGRYLRTGDLGVMRNGELYPTGRLKDLIIIHGQKFSPHDIESTVEVCHPGIRLGAIVAFALNGDRGEHLVVVAELKREWMRKLTILGEIASAIREAIFREHSVIVHDAVLLRAGTLPKTSSGKVRRNQSRSDYLGDVLCRLDKGAPMTS